MIPRAVTLRLQFAMANAPMAAEDLGGSIGHF